MNQKIKLVSLILFVFFSFSNTSCKKKKSTTESTIAIGDKYQGGIVVYILKLGDIGFDSKVQHGIIAAPYDQSTGTRWFNGSFVSTGARGSAVGTGKANTDKILSVQGTGKYAAKVCTDLDLGGYQDWYLPSIDELAILYKTKDQIGGFDTRFSYWSSTEASSNSALDLDFSNGEEYWCNGVKDGAFYIRAVRSF